jgi:hypothetical protein
MLYRVCSQEGHEVQISGHVRKSMIIPRANLLLVATTASAHRMHRACFPSVGLRAPDLRAYRIVTRAGSIPMASAANLGLEPPSEDDIRVIEERQLGHKMSNIIGVGMRCKHGYPQAFAFDPVRRAPWAYGERKSKIESGLFRLSCPLLVKAVDEWEAEGAVKKINEEVVGGTDGSGTNQGGADGSLAALLVEAHIGHAKAREELVGERMAELLEVAEAAGEEQQQVVEMVLASGIAGQTRTKTDIKCVHAQLGDHLCRSASNGVAAELLRRLEADRQVEVQGNCECCNQCNLAVPESVARREWWYEPSKNKWKLRKTARRYRAMREAGELPYQREKQREDLPSDELEIRDLETPDRAGGVP